MKMRFFNAKIWDGEKLFDGELRVEGDKIARVSPVSTLEWQHWDREIDCGGNLIMPSFKNGHTHSPMAFLRSYAEDLPLQEWLSEKVFPAEALLTDEDCYHLTRLACAEYFAGGTTFVCEMYGHTRAVAKALADSGVAAVVTEGILDFDGSPKFIEDKIDDSVEYYKNFPARVRYGISIHAQYTCGEGTLGAVKRAVDKYKMPLFAHVSETAREVASCKEQTGKAPFEYLAGKGLFDFGGAAFHCVHVTSAEMEIMAQKGVAAVTCPSSNLKLASGIAPLAEMKKRGVKIGIGTDGAASNNALDMFRETYLAAVLQKCSTGDAAAMGAEFVLGAATRASAYGAEGMDALAPGSSADFVLIDLHAPNMQPGNDIVNDVVYAAGKHNVMMTVAGGKVVFENGKADVGTDYDALAERCRAIAKRVADERARA